jgi:citrate lyase subunit beta/citryl-CoA lyase
VELCTVQRVACLRSYATGFTGKLAIHPDQVGVINSAFQPSAAEPDHARRVIAAFEAAAEFGALSMDGTMIDSVQRHAARRLLGGQRSVRAEVTP